MTTLNCYQMQDHLHPYSDAVPRQTLVVSEMVATSTRQCFQLARQSTKCYSDRLQSVGQGTGRLPRHFCFLSVVGLGSPFSVITTTLHTQMLVYSSRVWVSACCCDLA